MVCVFEWTNEQTSGWVKMGGWVRLVSANTVLVQWHERKISRYVKVGKNKGSAIKFELKVLLSHIKISTKASSLKQKPIDRLTDSKQMNFPSRQSVSTALRLPPPPFPNRTSNTIFVHYFMCAYLERENPSQFNRWQAIHDHFNSILPQRQMRSQQ